MATSMQRLRESHLEKINGIPVLIIEDFQNSTKFHLSTGKTEHLTLPISECPPFLARRWEQSHYPPFGNRTKSKALWRCLGKEFSFHSRRHGCLQ